MTTFVDQIFFLDKRGVYRGNKGRELVGNSLASEEVYFLGSCLPLSWLETYAPWFYYPIYRSPYLYHGLLLLIVCIGTPIYFMNPEAMFDGGFDFRIDIYRETFVSKEFTALIVAVTALASTAFTYFVQFSMQTLSRWNKIKPFFTRHSERIVYAYAQLDIVTFWSAIAIFYVSVLSVTIVTFSCTSEEHPMESCAEWYQFDYILKIVAATGTAHAQVMRVYLCPEFYGDFLYFISFIIRISFFWWWARIGLPATACLMSFVFLTELRHQYKWYVLSQNAESRNRKKQVMKAQIEMLLTRSNDKKREGMGSGDSGPDMHSNPKDRALSKHLGRIDEEDHMAAITLSNPSPVSHEGISINFEGPAGHPESKSADSSMQAPSSPRDSNSISRSNSSSIEEEDQLVNGSGSDKESNSSEEIQSSSFVFLFSLVWTIISGDHFGTTSTKLYSDGFLTAQNQALCKVFDFLSLFFSSGRVAYLCMVYSNRLSVHRMNNVRIRIAVCFIVLLGVKWVSQFVIERILVRLERSVQEVEEENLSMRVSLDMLLPPRVIDNMIHSINKENKRKNYVAGSLQGKNPDDNIMDPIVTSEFIVYRIPAEDDHETALVDGETLHKTGQSGSSLAGSSQGVSLNSESQSDNGVYSGSDSVDESEVSEQSVGSWVKRVNTRNPA